MMTTAWENGSCLLIEDFCVYGVYRNYIYKDGVSVSPSFSAYWDKRDHNCPPCPRKTASQPLRNGTFGLAGALT
jgi:hypothetical protein